MIALGAIVVAASDLKSDYMGLVMVVMNNSISAVYFNLNRTVCEKNPRLNAMGQTFYNATISAPLSLIAAYFVGDIEMALNFTYTPNMLLLFFGSSVFGISLTIAQILCNIYNSPITTTITMNMKDLAGTLMGIIFFNDVVLTPSFVAGLVLSLLGACYYSFIKLQETREKAKESKSS